MKTFPWILHGAIGMLLLLTTTHLTAGGNDDRNPELTPDLTGFPLYLLKVTDETLTAWEKDPGALSEAMITNIRKGHDAAKQESFDGIGFYWVSGAMLCQLYGVRSDFALDSKVSYVTIDLCHKEELDEMLHSARNLMYEIERTQSKHKVSVSDWVTAVAKTMSSDDARIRIRELTDELDRSNERAQVSANTARHYKKTLEQAQIALVEAKDALEAAASRENVRAARGRSHPSRTIGDAVLVQRDPATTLTQSPSWTNIFPLQVIYSLLDSVSSALKEVTETLNDAADAARAEAAAARADFSANLPPAQPEVERVGSTGELFDPSLLDFDDAQVFLAGPTPSILHRSCTRAGCTRPCLGTSAGRR